MAINGILVRLNDLSVVPPVVHPIGIAQRKIPMKPRFLSVAHNARYQHYGERRNPPWIKLYREFMSDYTLQQMTVESRLFFACCFLLASETGNKIPFDVQYLSQRLGFTVTLSVISPLINGGCLLASVASRTLAYERKCSTLLFSSSPDLEGEKIVKKRGNGQAKNETLFPNDFAPTENHAKLAAARGLELNLEVLHFKGKAQLLGWVSGNWSLKFTNWLLQEIKFRQARRPS